MVVKQYTFKSYDEKQAMDQLRTFAIGMMVTLAMHAWQGFTTPLVLAWLQPVFICLDPIFQVRVLGVKRDVQRPVQDALKKCGRSHATTTLPCCVLRKSELGLPCVR